MKADLHSSDGSPVRKEANIYLAWHAACGRQDIQYQLC